MTADLARALQALAEALPPGSAIPVPREALLALLARPDAVLAVPRDFTVPDLCAQFGRKPSAVRAWLERDDFPGAYKLKGRDWRVPAAAVETFRARQAGGAGEPEEAPGDLGAWRRLRKG